MGVTDRQPAAHLVIQEDATRRHGGGWEGQQQAKRQTVHTSSGKSFTAVHRGMTARRQPAQSTFAPPPRATASGMHTAAAEQASRQQGGSRSSKIDTRVDAGLLESKMATKPAPPPPGAWIRFVKVAVEQKGVP